MEEERKLREQELEKECQQRERERRKEEEERAKERELYEQKLRRYGKRNSNVKLQDEQVTTLLKSFLKEIPGDSGLPILERTRVRNSLNSQTKNVESFLTTLIRENDACTMRCAGRHHEYDE